MNNRLRTAIRDTVRVVILLVMIYSLTSTDKLAEYLSDIGADRSITVLAFAAGSGLFLLLVGHIVRKVLLHKIDLMECALIAVKEVNLPAAIIFFSVIYFVINFLEILAKFLH
jgi:hypothetical protein